MDAAGLFAWAVAARVDRRGSVGCGTDAILGSDRGLNAVIPRIREVLLNVPYLPCKIVSPFHGGNVSAGAIIASQRLLETRMR